MCSPNKNELQAGQHRFSLSTTFETAKEVVVVDTAISSKQIGLPRFRALLLSLVVMLTMVLAPSVARADSTVTDLASLKTALTTGGIITLTADITVSEDLTINSGIPTTLKGNNKTITVTAGKHIGVAADNTLIVDQGITIKNEASSIVDTLVLVQKGSFKLTGGKIINTTGTPIHANIPKSIEVTSGEILGNSPVASGIAALNGGIVKISGGTITATGRDNACAIDTYDGVKTVISGGTFNATATEVSAKKNSVCVQGSGSIDFDLVGNTEIKLAAGLAYSDGMNYKRLHEPVTIPANFAAPIDNPFMESLQTVTIDAATTDAALQATLVPSAGGKQALKVRVPPMQPALSPSRLPLVLLLRSK